MISEIEHQPTTKYYKDFLKHEFLKGNKASQEFKDMAIEVLNTASLEQPSFTQYLKTLMEKKLIRPDRIASCTFDHRNLTADEYEELVNQAQKNINRAISNTLQPLFNGGLTFLKPRTIREKAELRQQNVFTAIFQPLNTRDEDSEDSDIDDEFALNAHSHGLPSKRLIGQRPSSGEKREYLYDDQDIFNYITSIGYRKERFVCTLMQPEKLLIGHVFTYHSRLPHHLSLQFTLTCFIPDFLI